MVKILTLEGTQITTTRGGEDTYTTPGALAPFSAWLPDAGLGADRLRQVAAQRVRDARALVVHAAHVAVVCARPARHRTLNTNTDIV